MAEVKLTSNENPAIAFEKSYSSLKRELRNGKQPQAYAKACELVARALVFGGVIRPNYMTSRRISYNLNQCRDILAENFEFSVSNDAPRGGQCGYKIEILSIKNESIRNLLNECRFLQRLLLEEELLRLENRLNSEKKESRIQNLKKEIEEIKEKIAFFKNVF